MDEGSKPVDFSPRRAGRRSRIAMVVIILLGSGFFALQRADLGRRREAAAREAQRYRERIAELIEENLRLAAEIGPRRAAGTLPESEGERDGELGERRPARMQALNALVDILENQGGGGSITAMRNSAAMSASLGFDGGSQAVISIPGVYDFGWSRRLPDGFAPLFGLSEADANELNVLLAETVETVETIVRRRTRVKEVDAGNWIITTQGSPIEANALANALMTKFEWVLGPEGYDAFARLNGRREPGSPVAGGPQDFFDGFGYYGHIIRVFRTDEGEYRFRNEWTNDRGDRPASSAVGGGASSYAQLRKKLGIFGQMLPEVEPISAAEAQIGNATSSSR